MMPSKNVMIDGVLCRPCSKCKDVKPVDDFYKTNTTYKPYCIECDKKRGAAWREKQGAKTKKYKRITLKVFIAHKQPKPTRSVAESLATSKFSKYAQSA